jgi:hypothetical protein
MGGIFIHEFLHVEEFYSVANSTFIIYYSMMNKVGLVHCSRIMTSDKKCMEIDLIVLNLQFVHNFATEKKNVNSQQLTWHPVLCTWIDCELVAVVFTSHYHRNCRACNMFVIDWLLLMYMYQPTRHIFKLVDYFG